MTTWWMAALSPSELLSEATGVLVLLAAVVVVYRTFRERYLLCWVLGWASYLLYKLAGVAGSSLGQPPALTLLTHLAFALATYLFVAAVFFYTNQVRRLVPVSVVAAVAVLVATVHAVVRPWNGLDYILHGLYFAMGVFAAFHLARFGRGRRAFGPWLLTVMLLLLHVDESPAAVHLIPGLDTTVELLLGVGMIMTVLEESRNRDRRFRAVHSIAESIAQAHSIEAILLTALSEMRELFGARGTWFRLAEEGNLIIRAHLGVSYEFVREQEAVALADSFGGTVLREGHPLKLSIGETSGKRHESLKREGFHHVVLVPVRGKSSVLGTLVMGIPHERSYTPDDFDFLSAVAHQIGLAVDNLHMMEQVLRSQRQWVSTFDSIEDFILVHDNAGRIIKANRPLLARLGMEPGQVAGHICESVLPNAGQWSRCPYCTAPENLETADPCFDGGVVLVSSSSYDEEGTHSGVVHVVRDVTQQRRAEEKYRQLFEQVHEAVFISTPQGRVTDCNMAFVKLLGFETKQELMEADIARDIYVEPIQREVFRAEMSDKGFVQDYEVTLRRRDGRIITVLENSVATRNSAGQIDRYQGFLLDITVKKQAEEDIRRRNRELAALNAVAVEAAESFDMDGILKTALQQIVELFKTDTAAAYLIDENQLLKRRAGWGHQTELGRKMPDVRIPEDFWAGIYAQHTEVVTSDDLPRLPQVVTDFVALEGLRSWIWVVMWAKDRVVGVIGTSSRNAREFNATDRSLMVALGRQLATTIAKVQLYDETIRAYDHLRRAQEQLLQSEKMSAVGQLISGVAHELNNPLTAILGYAQLLETEKLTAKGADYVHKLFKQTQRTHRVVQNLLSFARQRKPAKNETDLRTVIEDALALRDYDLKINNVIVEREFGPDLPATIGDAHQLEQVFLNIVNNAADAMLEGARGGTLAVRLFRQDQMLVAEFHDSGPGVKDPTRVFDPFYTTKPVGKGTGLGLSICYGIVKEHAGDVKCFNHPEGGAVFQVFLPVSIGARVPEDGSRAPEEKPVLVGRVLVVDDEEAVLDFEREALSASGAEVTALTDGAEAIALLQRESFDAVVLDGKMPGGWSGVEIYGWILDHQPQLAKHVLFTFSNLDDSVREFVKQYQIACLVKPFQVPDLTSMVRRLMTKAQATTLA